MQGDALVPAYYVEVRVRDGLDRRRVSHYAYVVSAADGSLLFRKSQVAHAAYGYRVFAEPQAPYLPFPTSSGRNGFPHPTGTPDGYQGPTVAPNLVTLENLPFSRNDPWLPAGATKTSGNNVEVYADLVAPDLLGPVDPNECALAAPLNGDLHACTNGPNTCFGSSFAPTAPWVRRADWRAARMRSGRLMYRCLPQAQLRRRRQQP